MEIMKHTFLLHTSAPIKGSTGEYYKEILSKSLELIKVLNQPFIADRFHIGETVYGSIFRGYNLDYTNIERELIHLGVKQIYITATVEVLVDRIKKRGDWHIAVEDIKPLVKRYEDELKKSTLPTYTLDTSNDIQPEDIKDLIQFIYS